MQVLPNSLARRIQVLGLLVAIFIVGCAIAFLLVLENSETQTLTQTTSHLAAVAASLARDYQSRAQYETSEHGVPPLDGRAVPAQDVLSLMTTVALRREIGTEGGFYSAAGDELLGYAFPTHEGPGAKKDMPQKELPAILELARKASSTRQPQSLVFRGQRDAIVFCAAPVVLSGQSPGAVWVMKRMPGLQAQQSARTYLGWLLLGVLAVGCVVMAFLIARNLATGIVHVEERLADLESDLTLPPKTLNDVAEVERIHAGINRLATTLRERMDKQRDLESKLRNSERLAALGKVAAGVAHELRNPLATIRLRTQMSNRETSDPALQRNAAIVLDEVSRLDTMVERLLYFSRPLKLSVQRVGIADILKAAVETQSAPASANGVEIQLVLGVEDIEVQGDPSALRQVFDNLIRNAVEAQEGGGGKVLVRVAKASAQQAEIMVQDEGPGISTENMPRIFDPFFTTKAAGTGLGLSICYEIIKAHQGEIEIESQPGSGTRVRVLLPALSRQGSTEPREEVREQPA